MAEHDLLEIGQQLQAARERQDISLEQAEADTRIRLKYLAAMEAGDFDALPNRVVARGFLRSYARYLGLDPQPLLERLESVYPSPLAEPLQRPSREHGPHVLDMDLGRPVGMRWARVFWVILLLALAGVGFYWLWLQGYVPWGWGFAGPRSTPTAPPTVVPSPTWTLPPPTHAPAVISPTPLPQPTPTFTATPRPTSRPQVTPTHTATPRPTSTVQPSPVAKVDKVHVRLEITDRTWLRVLVDGRVMKVGLVEPQTTLEWEGKRVEIRTGNAGGVHMFLNGEDLGVLGRRGEVQHWIFYVQDNEIIRVTPTPTPTMS
ncbi:MAG: helix-turn-helix domain-containing protein [Chloroflexi bacterium]|nr:helix-turn-helix domain-containing protein [Chloroflexota bacterium]